MACVTLFDRFDRLLWLLSPGDVQSITFLYKLVPGVASSSFGLNVAVLAGLPPYIVSRAEAIASRFSSCFDETLSPEGICVCGS